MCKTRRFFLATSTEFKEWKRTAGLFNGVDVVIVIREPSSLDEEEIRMTIALGYKNSSHTISLPCFLATNYSLARGKLRTQEPRTKGSRNGSGHGAMEMLRSLLTILTTLEREDPNYLVVVAYSSVFK
jgi:hypothetical protein